MSHGRDGSGGVLRGRAVPRRSIRAAFIWRRRSKRALGPSQLDASSDSRAPVRPRRRGVPQHVRLLRQRDPERTAVGVMRTFRRDQRPRAYLAAATAIDSCTSDGAVSAVGGVNEQVLRIHHNAFGAVVTQRKRRRRVHGRLAGDDERRYRAGAEVGGEQELDRGIYRQCDSYWRVTSTAVGEGKLGGNRPRVDRKRRNLAQHLVRDKERVASAIDRDRRRRVGVRVRTMLRREIL